MIDVKNLFRIVEVEGRCWFWVCVWNYQGKKFGNEGGLICNLLGTSLELEDAILSEFAL